MVGKKRLLLLVVFTLVLALGSFVFAEEIENFDIDMIELTKEAADVQLSLSDRGYMFSEVRKELSPYFTEQFIDHFITTNMMKESDGLYYVMGTDFPLYYIPFFSYQGDTRVITDPHLDQTIVYEYFRASTDGPVGYDNHYEAVVYTLENEVWKVEEIIYEFDLKQFESAEEEINTIQEAVQANGFEESTVEEATLAEKSANFFRMVKSFFTSFFGSIYLNNKY